MPQHFSSPHCTDVIEIRTLKDTPGVGCIRIVPGQYQLLEVKGAGLELVGLFGTLARHQPVSS